MKKIFITLSLVSILLCSCENDTIKDPRENNHQENTSAIMSTETPNITRDFPEVNYADIGNGIIEIVTPSGSSKEGNIPFIFINSDTSLTQIGLNTSGFNGAKLSFIYIDGMLNDKKQMAEFQGTLNLSGELLSQGIHTLEVVQYADDTPTSNIILYKSAKYEVKPT